MFYISNFLVDLFYKCSTKFHYGNQFKVCLQGLRG